MVIIMQITITERGQKPQAWGSIYV